MYLLSYMNGPEDEQQESGRILQEVDAVHSLQIGQEIDCHGQRVGGQAGGKSHSSHNKEKHSQPESRNASMEEILKKKKV